jgi:hypothetical protein
VKLFLLTATATLCFAATESRVSRAAILSVQSSINQSFAPRGVDPYHVLGDARGTYLEGYGTLFTIELDLINPGLAISPFRPAMTPEELESMRDRKLKKLVAMKETMRTLMMNASGTLAGLPPNERVAMEAILITFSWENTRGLPQRVFMSAEKRKLLDARAAHAGQAELAAIIEEQER